ncbi:MAG: aminotransferase class III-fold pyridoxal phosphate-dependent enzyme [Pseudomonadota bacterium]
MTLNATLESHLADARERFMAARPNTDAAHSQACKVMPGGNTRTVLYHGPFPIRVARGEDQWLHDLDGHRYLDLLGEYTAGLFGHTHPAIRRAIGRALDTGLNLGAHSEREVELADLVTTRFPAMERVRFTNSGTEANLLACTLARHVTGREKLLVFDGGYHGALLYFGAGGDGVNAPFPYVRAPFNDAAETRRQITAHADDLAAVLVEPMLGSGGCIPATEDFLSTLRDACSASGALLIVDEVMTSRFASDGRSGAAAIAGVAPDLMTLGKWVGGGVSFGAFGGRADLMACFDPAAPNALPHAGTFNNNTLSMTAGIAGLAEVFPASAAEQLHERGDRLRSAIAEVFSNHQVDLSVTGCGSLMNIHPSAGPDDRAILRPADVAARNDAARELLFLDLLEKGIYIARRGFIALSLAVTDADLARFVDTLDEVVSARRSVLPTRSAAAVYSRTAATGAHAA